MSDASFLASDTISEPMTSISGQVCDRCRKKKIKCNGGSPCEKCVAAGAQCEASTQLRRKTKARGFSSTDSEFGIRLQRENVELKEQLEAERKLNQKLREEYKMLSQVMPEQKRKRYENSQTLSNSTIHRPLVSVSSGSESTMLDRNAYVVKHMGRMVRDEAEIGRFAGSTTGVHFILSVQEICRSQPHSMDPFPEICYKTHLLQPTDNTRNMDPASGVILSTDSNLPLTFKDAQERLNMTLEDISRHLYLFETHWQGFCPVVVREQVLQKTEQLFRAENELRKLEDIDYAVLQTILLVMAINNSSEPGAEAYDYAGAEASESKLQLACRIHMQILPKVDPWSLQALILFALYVQKSGKRLWMISLNGVMVRTAQSLGLHRHARRFKMDVGEVEWRKRLWWSVYIFDKLTSITHGLPQLISDADVDCDLPIDCMLQDIKSTQLSHPLPGEPTPVSLFGHYAKLAKILSSALARLYTTTDRRGGSGKIKQLDMDLQVWNSTLNNHPHMKRFVLGENVHKGSRTNILHEHILIGTWLELLANMTRILIHQPGLTFDPSTNQFRDSLNICVTSAAAIINLLTNEALDRRLLILVPSGPNLVFRCGLMQVFYQCHIPNDSDHRILSCGWSRVLVDQCINLLGDISNMFIKGITYGEAGDDCAPPLHDLVQTLARLQQVLHRIEATMTTEHLPSQQVTVTPVIPSFESDPSHGQIPHELTPDPNVDIWGTGELESLNQFGTFDNFLEFVPSFHQPI